ncbi:serine carboxypeptidase [bacterium]|nr:serine carboxypeptidase [bacterium]
MTSGSLKEIVSVSIGSSLRDHTFECEFLGERYLIRRIGTDGDKQKARELIKEYDNKASAIGLGGIDVFFQVGNRTYVHKDGMRLMKAAKKTPVVDGSGLKHTLERWAIAYLHNVHPEILKNRRVLVMSGIDRSAMAEVISEFASKVSFGDFLFNLRLSIVIKNLASLKRIARYVLPILCKLPFEWIYPTGRRQETRHERYTSVFKKSDVVVGDFHQIRRYAPLDLKGKSIITNTVTADDRKDLKSRGVEWLITTTPIMDGRTFGANVLEALFIAHLTSQGYELDREVRPSVTLRDEYLNLILESGIEPSIEQLNPVEEKVTNQFAFVVHPLKLSDVFEIKAFRWLRNLPPALLEMALAQLPPVHVSRTSVITTPDGKQTQGSLYALIMTPKMMMRLPEERVYTDLVKIANLAKQRSIGIMGLGAFTSVVGDAGLSVAKRSPIPVTSGNSLTIWATVETAKQACKLMGIKLSSASVMVVGATGSIGKAITRMLAPQVGRMVIISRRPERVLEFSREIQSVCPDVNSGTVVETLIGEMDLVIATTTDPDGVVDVMALKSGCVVLDVARPPDVSKEQAERRDDVLIIESGEIRIPGEVDWGVNIGMPPNIAYACLAETILLAVSGRFESYTLGRELDIEKIRKIGELAIQNGFELSEPISFGRMLSREDITAIRNRAQSKS